MFGYDIAAVDPVPGHVVLSACEVFCARHDRLARGERPAAALAPATANVSAGSAPAPLICFGAGW